MSVPGLDTPDNSHASHDELYDLGCKRVIAADEEDVWPVTTSRGMTFKPPTLAPG
jgi:hypothetical protein